MKKIWAKIIRGLMVLVAKLPLRFHYAVGSMLSWFAEKVLRYRSGMVWMNISRSFPQMKYGQLKKIYADFYVHFGELFAETVWFGGSDYKRLQKAGIVTVVNPEVLEEAYLSSPSVTLLCSHCGNWELLGGILAYMTDGGRRCPFSEKEVSVVYKKLKNEVSDMVFAGNRMAPLPVKYPECEVESQSVLRFSIRNKDIRRIYIYPADQAPYWKMGRHDMGLFLNQRTYAMTGSVGVACKLSHAVVYLKMRRIERGKYEWEFIPICQDASQSSPEDIMRQYYRCLEDEINETPANWLWSHNRWKTK